VGLVLLLSLGQEIDARPAPAATREAEARE